MYVYQHTNGKYIKKPDCIATPYCSAREYFDSDFVVKYWHFDTEEEADKFITAQISTEKTTSFEQ